MTNEVNDMAGQHETIAENLSVNISEQVTQLVLEMKAERKKVIWAFYMVKILYRISPYGRFC